MSDEFDAKRLLGFETYIAPNSPTLAVFRLETEDGNQFFLVTKEIALQLSESFAQLSTRIGGFQ